jgi:hypothetical protein
MGETEEWDLHPVDTFPIILYKLNDEEERFDKIDVNSIEGIHPYLIFSNIVLVIDTKGHVAYLWVGKEASVHMKFLAAQISPQVRDRHGSMSTMQLHNIEQSEESEISGEFKSLLKLS